MQQAVDGDLYTSASDKTITYVILKHMMKAKSYPAKDGERIQRKTTLHQMKLIYFIHQAILDHKRYKGISGCIFQQKISIP
jgi:hypothetical protein